MPLSCAYRARGNPARETPRARQPARQRQPDREQQTAHAPALKRGTHRRPRKTHYRAIGRWSAGQRETAASRSRAAEKMRWRPFSHGLNTACNKMGRYETDHVLKLSRDFPPHRSHSPECLWLWVSEHEHRLWNTCNVDIVGCLERFRNTPGAGESWRFSYTVGLAGKPARSTSKGLYLILD